MVEFDSGTLIKLHKVDETSLNNTIRKFMLPDEGIVGIYKTVRDTIIFTDRRIIATDVKGSGKKQDMTTIPYHTIQKYSIQTSGILDTDSEVEIHLLCGETLRFEFMGSKALIEVGQALARFAL